MVAPSDIPGLGSGTEHRPEDLRRALDVDRTLFEFRATGRPMSDLRLFRARIG